MKLLLFAILFLSFYSQAQLISGDLVSEGRKLMSSSDFKINGSKTGDIYFELAVDRMGNVTSQRLMVEKTSVTSTPTRMRAQEYVSDFKFEPGTHFPHFQSVVVKISVVLTPPATPSKSPQK